MEEFMFLGLRQTAGITAEAFYQAFETPIERVYQAPLQQLKQEGLLETREGRIYLTEQGLDLSNYALSKFLF
jgi:oxygen-independent coproporphyrinogen-3 oxidase